MQNQQNKLYYSQYVSTDPTLLYPSKLGSGPEGETDDVRDSDDSLEDETFQLSVENSEILEEKDTGSRFYDPMGESITKMGRMIAVGDQKDDFETSFEYDDESMDGSIIGDDDEDENFQFIDSDLDTHSSQLLATKTKEIEQDRMLFFNGTLFCFVLTLSFALWIFVFNDLSKRNGELSKILLNNPTLGTYYDLYKEFYVDFDDSRDGYMDTMDSLDLRNNEEYDRYKKNIISIILIKEQLENQLLTIKQQMMEVDSDHNEVAIDVEYVNGIVSKMKIEGNKLKTIFGLTLINQVDFDSFYDGILSNIDELYKKSFKLIDMYGEFYGITNRIWVTSENIFHLFEKRALEVYDETYVEHYTPMQGKYEDIKLSYYQYKQGAKINEMKSFTFNHPVPMFFACFINSEVNNKDLKSLDHSFNLSLVVNNKNPFKGASDFLYKVNEKISKNTFQEAVKLEPGKNVVNLYAKLNKGDLHFNYIDIDCLLFKEYSQFEEFSID